MKHSLVFLAGLVLLANPVPGDEGSEPDEVEIIIADRKIVWEDAPVFYVDAPPNIANEVVSTVRELIRKNQDRCQLAKDTREETICDERNFRVFVAVTGDGTQLLSGFACGESLDLPYLKYYRHDLVSEAPCLTVDWLDDERQFEVSEGDG